MKTIEITLLEFHDLKKNIQKQLANDVVNYSGIADQHHEFDDEILGILEKMNLDAEIYYSDDVDLPDNTHVMVSVWHQEIPVIKKFPKLYEAQKDWEIEISIQMEVTDIGINECKANPANKHTKELEKYYSDLAKKLLIPKLKEIAEKIASREKVTKEQAIKELKTKLFYPDGREYKEG